MVKNSNSPFLVNTQKINEKSYFIPIYISQNKIHCEHDFRLCFYIFLVGKIFSVGEAHVVLPITL